MAELPPGFELVPMAQKPEAGAGVPGLPPGFELMPDSGDDEPSVLGDVAKAAGSGVVRGVAMMPGVVGDAASGVEWLAERLARQIYGDEQVDKVKATRAASGGSNPVDRALRQNVPTSSSLNELARQYAPGADYDPKTTAGEYARTVGEFAPNALAGPGSIAKKLLRYGVGAGVASEGAGQATEGTKLEPYARVAGALVGGAAPTVARAVAPGSRSAEAALQTAMKGLSPEQITRAETLMSAARARGITLTWPEALQQVTDGAAPGMATLQRFAEADLNSKATIGPIMGARPGQIDQAVTGALDTIAPQSQAPSTIGPLLARNAESEVRATEAAINQHTEPLYTRARGDIVPATEMQALTDNPVYMQGLERVRADPALNRGIANLPDDSVVVVDSVKQWLQERGQNLARPIDPEFSMTRSVGYTQAAQEARQTARNASSNMQQALAEQAALRQTELVPLQEGQLGKIAKSGDTRAATEALLPNKPMPGSAIETADTTGRLVVRDPQLTAQAIRVRLEDQFAQKARDLQAGPNQYGGAEFRKAVYGTQPLRENLRAAVSELPNGQQIADGLDELMTVLEATGRREKAGSLTTFNAELQRTLKSGSAIGEALTDSARMRPLGWIRDRYERWTLGQNMNELATLITDPAMRDKLIELAQVRGGGDTARRAALQAQLAASIIERGEDKEPRKPSQGLVDAMMPKGKGTP